MTNDRWQEGPTYEEKVGSDFPRPFSAREAERRKEKERDRKVIDDLVGAETVHPERRGTHGEEIIRFAPHQVAGDYNISEFLVESMRVLYHKGREGMKKVRDYFLSEDTGHQNW